MNLKLSPEMQGLYPVQTDYKPDLRFGCGRWPRWALCFRLFHCFFSKVNCVDNEAGLIPAPLHDCCQGPS